jgi:hypothetical protein
MTKPKWGNATERFSLGTSSFVIRASFDIRHSTFGIPELAG